MAGPDLDAPAVGRRIAAGAARMGVALGPEALEELAAFVALLQAWNARLNLIGEHDVATVVDRHVVDALAAVPLLRDLPPGSRLADLGSGAGLPGVPLAVALRPAEMVLVEPRRKRASFLRAVHRALPRVPLRVVEARAEDVAEDEPGAFAVVVTRAALPDATLLPLAERLLEPNGLLLSYRGVEPPVSEDRPGLSTARAHAYRLDERRRPFQIHVRRRLRST